MSPPALSPAARARYTELTLVGAGGLGEVYRCRDQVLGRAVALKFVRPDLQSTPRFLARFRREVRLLAAVEHPNVVRIFDVVDDGGPLFYSMELVEGRTLADLVGRGQVPSARWGVALMADVASGVAAAHRAGVLHRDLKLENVMVDPAGRPILMDFGCGRYVDDAEHTALTREGEVVGTYLTMAPETLLGGDTDERSDVYGLGLMAYGVLAGRLPFESVTVSDLVRLYRGWTEATLPPPSRFAPALDAGLDRLVTAALHADPAKRTQTAGDFEAACRRWLAPAAPASSPPPPPARSARPRWTLPAAAVLLAALGLWAAGPRSRPVPSPLALFEPSVVAGATRATVTFRTAEPRRLDWWLVGAVGGKIAARGVEAASDREHRVELAGLAPGTSYALVARDGGEVARLGVSTRPVALRRGVLALASLRALWADLEVDSPEGVELAVTSPGSEALVPCPGGRGPVVVEGLSGHAGAAFRWELRCGGLILASGDAPCAPRPVEGLRPLRRLPDGSLEFPRPAGGPLWVGEQVVCADSWGEVRGCELERVTGARPPHARGDEHVALAWAAEPGGPPEQAARWAGGLGLLSGSRVVVFSVPPAGPLEGWGLDPALRARRWRELGGLPYAYRAPVWLFAQGAPWNVALAPGEWRRALPLPAVPAAGGLAEGGSSFLLLPAPGRCSFARLDADAGRLRWLREVAVPVPGTGAGGPLLEDVSGLVLARGRLAAVVRAVPSDGTGPEPCWLCWGQVADAASEGGGALPFQRHGYRSGLAVDGGDVVFTGDGALLRLRGAGARSEALARLPPPPPDAIEYLTGRPLFRDGAWYAVRVTGVPASGTFGRQVVGRLWSWRPGVGATTFEPPLFRCTSVEDSPGVVSDLAVTGRWLVGCARAALFAVDLGSGRMGAWTPGDVAFDPPGISRNALEAMALGPRDLAAVVDGRGRLHVVPVELVARSGTGRLAGFEALGGAP